MDPLVPYAFKKKIETARVLEICREKPRVMSILYEKRLELGYDEVNSR